MAPSPPAKKMENTMKIDPSTWLNGGDGITISTDLPDDASASECPTPLPGTLATASSGRILFLPIAPGDKCTYRTFTEAMYRPGQQPPNPGIPSVDDVDV